MVDYPEDFGPRRDHVDDPVAQRKVRRELILKRLTVGLVAVGILGCLGASAYASLANNQTLTVVKDCTDPAGDCYKDGQKRTTQAVGNIAANNILAIVCALQVPDGTPLREALTQVTACVEAHQPKSGG
jgi:hypothetical protein